MGSISCHG